ncbi:PREDICTED: uncharacterized protein LOC109178453 [Ipomoea nil]|uniref:uncharacterized protein LOC109178453 n=1 Tax=Ipomoea nil TaxID=35883 RepID=UPI0009011E3D|nr:PREDICTED: uncharacterized protein LOC109178453 [Ipomoea nil]
MNKIGETLLIGKFSYGRPVLSVIREHFAKRLKLKGTVSVGLVDPRHVSLAFSNPEDCINTLVKGQILLDGKCPMRLFRWTMDFDTRFETSLAPVWVLLPNLKANCFSEPCLKQIVKPIGRFLQVDTPTAKFTRPSVARVKVEIDLLKPPCRKMFIRLGTARPDREAVGFWQVIEYERIPPYCLNCRKQGHLANSCRVPGGGASAPRSSAPHVSTSMADAGPLPSGGVGQDWGSAIVLDHRDMTASQRKKQSNNK